MLVDVSTNAYRTDTGVTLTRAERDEVELLAADLTDLPPRQVDDDGWLAAAREMSAQLPLRLRQTLRRFAQDAGSAGVLLLRNLPVRPEELPDTPSVRGSVQRAATVPAGALLLIAHQLGEIIAFAEEKSGAMVQDVVPVPGMESFQGNAGSTTLNMHVENAFHPYRPDYVGLLCLRNDHDNTAGLQVASIRRALPLVSDRVREILFQPRFVTEAPASFGLLDQRPVPHGILGGAVDDPDIKIDLTSTIPQDDGARDAMAELGRALAEVCQTLILEPGDLAMTDNRLALHGRTEFRPRYDGRDRWLQRVFVNLDYRRSRQLRHANGHVITGLPA